MALDRTFGYDLLIEVAPLLLEFSNDTFRANAIDGEIVSPVPFWVD
jgi:hypothetical protein